MIKLYEIQDRFPKSNFSRYTYDEADIKSDDTVTEGYFMTIKQLQDLFHAARHVCSVDEGTNSWKYETVDEYLKEKI